MKFLSRKMQATETVREEGRVVQREIEITVEREWLAVPMQDAAGAPEVEMPALELPPFTKLV